MTRIAISNIAWDVAEDEAVAALLQNHGIDAIDVAPTKYFPDISRAGATDVEAVRSWWAERGVHITGMQSLLFGTQGLNLFGPPDVQEAMLGHLKHICRIGAGLGAQRLVFGSPRNRDRSGLDDSQCEQIATDFLRRLGDIAGAAGVCICLEPNPERYGANFMTTAEETARVVRQVGHPSIAMQFDTGALTISGESAAAFLAEHAELVGHVHLSEPDLLPLGEGSTDHATLAPLLRRHLPKHVLTIEMLAPQGEERLSIIDRSLGHARRHYREDS